MIFYYVIIVWNRHCNSFIGGTLIKWCNLLYLSSYSGQLTVGYKSEHSLACHHSPYFRHLRETVVTFPSLLLAVFINCSCWKVDSKEKMLLIVCTMPPVAALTEYAETKLHALTKRENKNCTYHLSFSQKELQLVGDSYACNPILMLATNRCSEYVII